MCPCLTVRLVQWGRFFAGIGKDFFGNSNIEQSDISLASVQGRNRAPAVRNLQQIEKRKGVRQVWELNSNSNS